MFPLVHCASASLLVTASTCSGTLVGLSPYTGLFQPSGAVEKRSREAVVNCHSAQAVGLMLAEVVANRS